MALDLEELVAALPAEVGLGPSAPDGLQQLLLQLSHRPVPAGSLARLWTLGGIQAKVTAAYLAYWIRSGYFAPDENQRRLNETHLTAAIQLFGGMSYLRGLVMKVGQVLASYPNILPAQYAEMLGRLHFEAPPMHYSLLREHVRNELGGDPDDIFGHFETQAFAAASLGQVHRARLKSGQYVAVKIQYPNIARTIRSDFRNLSAFLLPMRLTADWENMRDQFEYLREMLELECDYEKEAEFLRRARLSMREDDEVVVPRVYSEFSTRQVLTMDYLDGKHIEEFLATDPPQPLRDRHGAQILRSNCRLYYAAKMLYTDMHPGNFLFLPDGRLGLIDFGGCREFTDVEWEYLRGAHAALRGTRADVEEHCIRGGLLTELQRADNDRMRMMVEYCEWLWEPMKHDGPFDFGNEMYLRRGIDMLAECTRKRYTRGIPLNVFLSRVFLGYRAIAYRLRARVDSRAILEDELKAVGW